MSASFKTLYMLAMAISTLTVLSGAYTAFYAKRGKRWGRLTFYGCLTGIGLVTIVLIISLVLAFQNALADL